MDLAICVIRLSSCDWTDLDVLDSQLICGVLMETGTLRTLSTVLDVIDNMVHTYLICLPNRNLIQKTSSKECHFKNVFTYWSIS